MIAPNGVDLLKTLIKLYAEQEGIKVKCRIEVKERKCETNRS